MSLKMFILLKNHMLDDENKVLNLLKVNQVWLTYSYVY